MRKKIFWMNDSSCEDTRLPTCKRPCGYARAYSVHRQIPQTSKAYDGLLGFQGSAQPGACFQTVKQMLCTAGPRVFLSHLPHLGRGNHHRLAEGHRGLLRPRLWFARSSKVLLAQVMGSPCVARYQFSVSPQQARKTKSALKSHCSTHLSRGHFSEERLSLSKHR